MGIVGVLDWQAFPTWESVMCAPLTALADAIRVGGLAEIKAGRIIAILKTIKKERPGKALSLEFLRKLSDDDIRSYLSRFNGVGSVHVH